MKKTGGSEGFTLVELLTWLGLFVLLTGAITGIEQFSRRVNDHERALLTVIQGSDSLLNEFQKYVNIAERCELTKEGKETRLVLYLAPLTRTVSSRGGRDIVTYIGGRGPGRRFGIHLKPAPASTRKGWNQSLGKDVEVLDFFQKIPSHGKPVVTMELTLGYLRGKELLCRRTYKRSCSLR